MIIMSREDKSEKRVIIEKTAKSGITFGSAPAMVISYSAWHSVLWAIIHGVLGWLYVIYYVIRY